MSRSPTKGQLQQLFILLVLVVQSPVLSVKCDQTHSSASLRGHSHSQRRAADQPGRSNMDKYFPQFRRRCGGHAWKTEYRRLHEDIVSGRRPPYYVVSLPLKKGLADRTVGVVTEFYLALLSGRAFTMVKDNGLPGFEAACDMPYINWTHPLQLPDAAIKPLQDRLAHLDDNVAQVHVDHKYPVSGPVNSSTYYSLVFADQDPMNAQNLQLQQLVSSNLSQYPADNPTVPYVLAVGNRGQSYRMMSNPYHKQQLWQYGLRPETALMCGFFYLCTPKAAVLSGVLGIWKALSRPHVLRIGIAVRLGDSVLKPAKDKDKHSDIQTGLQILDKEAAPHFKCAAKLEEQFAVPGQPVVWYLMSDSMALRHAAKLRYGRKLLTDTSTALLHTAEQDCSMVNAACNHQDLNRAMQHAVGEMLAFSMADYHIYTGYSGFARLGAFVSGKDNSIYHVQEGSGCDPSQPTSFEDAAHISAHVRRM